MERDGFVMRVRSEADRRQIHIMLTDKGRGLQRSMANILAAVDDAALGGISKKDQRQLAELITRVIANLEPQISDRD
jgi:DNA-binding MarR family transcriptional regulator